jgi:hypothetical protein
MVLEHLAGRDASEKLHKVKIKETYPDGKY